VPVGATPDLRKTQDGCSLSLREIVAARSARVRGNGTQPTETAGRILQAQLDQLPAHPAQMAVDKCFFQAQSSLKQKDFGREDSTQLLLAVRRSGGIYEY
jgi:hypothetical protein